jgi:hypothetical protein
MHSGKIAVPPGGGGLVLLLLLLSKDFFSLKHATE